MKTSAVNTSKNQLSITAERFTALKLNEPIMKKLANTSPFLLLLLPVFMLMVFSLTINTNQNATGEIVVKPAKTSTSVVKQATAIFK
ncbi:hypothetical protein [Pedobacter sp. Leaf194]|uniref:hypothetical protein n=1 Tax=Pedobacter sp. Leaf194 TaxID=1736297 RepID=UPI0007025C72|nr:hypothetical protein [Pedobacter sp. Leaf194]KQS41397.1 hypothetical protein ASG14_02670 [Pedobacter sp. Leaf194]